MSAEQNINPQDYELLSAYIDGELTNDERITLEQRLAKDSFLQHELNSLRSTVSLIHTLPPMTAPRNFTLTEAMVKTANTPKIIPFKPRRRMRTEYLSLVASVMLMLFGVMFMVSETMPTQKLSTGTTAPIQSDTASEKIDPQVASAPTLLSTQADLQTERTVEEPLILGADVAEESKDIPSEDNAVMNMQAPAIEESTADLRQENFGSDDTDMPADGMLFSMEAASSIESTITDGEVEGYVATGETQLLDTLSDDDTFAQDAPPPMAASGGFADTEAINDTNITSDQILDSNGERDDVFEEAESNESSEAVGRIMSPATEIPPSPSSSQESLDREQSTSTQVNDNSQIGIGLLVIGLLLLVASIIIMRRNRS